MRTGGTFRLVELPDEALLDERKDRRAQVRRGPSMRSSTRRPGVQPDPWIRRFQHPPQEIEIARRATSLESGEHYGTIEAHDRAARTIDLKSKSACHPTAVFSKDVVNQDQPQKSVIRLAERLLQGSVSNAASIRWSGDRLGWRMAPLRSRSVRRRPTWRCVSSRTCARPRWLSRGRRAPARRSPARAWCWRWSAGKKVDHRDRSQGDRQPLDRSARAGRAEGPRSADGPQTWR